MHEGDAHFIYQTMTIRGEQPIWLEAVIYNVAC